MKSTKAILAENLDTLIVANKLSNRGLAKKTNGEVSDRYIGMLRNQTAAASVEVIDSLAQAFGLHGWQLVLPGLPPDPINSRRIEHLVNRYTFASEETRAYLDQIAEREAGYSSR